MPHKPSPPPHIKTPMTVRGLLSQISRCGKKSGLVFHRHLTAVIRAYRRTPGDPASRMPKALRLAFRRLETRVGGLQQLRPELEQLSKS